MAIKLLSQLQDFIQKSISKTPGNNTSNNTAENSVSNNNGASIFQNSSIENKKQLGIDELNNNLDIVKSIEEAQKEEKTEKEEESKKSKIFKGSFLDGSIGSYVTTKDISHSLPIEQYKVAQRYYTKEYNILFDYYTSKEDNDTKVIVTFPDGRNSILIDKDGNETELETTIDTHKSGRQAISYTIKDESGNSLTRKARYYSNNRLQDAHSYFSNSEGQLILDEHYILGQEDWTYEDIHVDDLTMYEYNENGEKVKETLSKHTATTTISVCEKFYEDGKVSKEILTDNYVDNFEKRGTVKHRTETSYEYDENGNLIKKNVSNYEKDNKNKSNEIIDFYDENGKNSATTIINYDKNGNLESREESKIEFDEKGNKDKKTKTIYDKNGNKEFSEEIKYEFDEKGFVTKTLTISNDIKNNRQTTEEYYADSKTKTTKLTIKDPETGNTTECAYQYKNEKLINWSQEITDIRGQVISKIDNEVLIDALANKGIDITEEEALIIGNYCDELSFNDLIYAYEKGYDKYLYNIADYGGLSHIKDKSATTFVMEDYNKLIETIKNKGSVEEVFCPTIKSKEEALNSLNVGDICTINNKTYIKNSSGMEELNISREKYLELFPPSARFSINQQESGDCYLVSALYSMEANPITYSTILRCFSENEDGSVTVKIPGNNSVTLTIPKNGKMDDFYTPSGGMSGKGKTYAEACEGIRALEYLYGFCILNENIDNLFNELDNAISMGDESAINKINNKIIEATNQAENKKGNGGDTKNVFKDFGLNVNNDKEDISDINKVYCLCCLTMGKGIYFEKTMAPIGGFYMHQYSMRPFYDSDGEIKYEITNPHHTSYSMVLTYDDLKESFGNPDIGSI